MKLISLYIENFGGLQEFSLEFTEGLTVIEAPNGAGKTTLAEFIRAMFYGFPRKAKALEKSKRQKYTPWQGGKFGGHLTFQLDGRRYRIQRTFGATPKADTFCVIDLQTDQISRRFSEDIGLELFRLDSDSFARSTYMPQLHDTESLTTDSIQAKLADLVEDTNDMGNYDSAVAALKAARSTLVPYRGSGGSVAEARGSISRLQRQLELLQEKQVQFTETCESIDGLTLLTDAREAHRDALQNRIFAASEATSVRTARLQHARLVAEVSRQEQELAALLQRYPAGLPEDTALQQAQAAASRLGVLSAATVSSPEDIHARDYLKNHESMFTAGIPEEKTLEYYRTLSDQFITLKADMDKAALTPGEQEQYDALLAMEKNGLLEQAHLAELETAIEERSKYQHLLENTAMPAADRIRLEQLSRYFAAGLPDNERIAGHRKGLAKAELLRRESRKMLTQLTEAAKSAPKAAHILLWILSVSALAASGGMLLYRLRIPGLALLAAGIASLIAAAALTWHRLSTVRKEQQALRSQIDTKEAEAARLEQAAAAFARTYTAISPLSDALHQIHDNRSHYESLTAQAAGHARRRQELTEKYRELTQMLTGQLGEGDFGLALRNLHLARQKLQDLRAKAASARETDRILAEQLNSRQEALLAFLRPFYPDVSPDSMAERLKELTNTAERYLHARERSNAWQLRKEAHEREVAANEGVLQNFFSSLNLRRQENIGDQLLQLRGDIREAAMIRDTLERARREAEDFAEANAEILAKEIPDTVEDTAYLQEQLRGEAEQLRLDYRKMNDLKLKKAALAEQLEQIPELELRLEEWNTRYAEDRKKAELLDDTMVFLDQARQNLQSSYLTPLRSRFRSYMNRLLDEREDSVLLTPDLEVSLERRGQARELGYFSAGQTDTVMLCMRLALADALFTGTKPFLILDDPFVNLDDSRTAEALCLIRELAKERQILYLVCHSSRTPS